jgi:ribosomal protein L3
MVNNPFERQVLSSYPSRVFKGMRMAGRMGGENVKFKTLEF